MKLIERHQHIFFYIHLLDTDIVINCSATPPDDDVIKWKHFALLPFALRIHRSPVNSAHKGQWCGALVFSLTCAWINGWVNNREAGDLRRHLTHYDVSVMARYQHSKIQGPISILRSHLTSLRIPIIKVMRSHDRFIFIKGNLIPGKTVYILRRSPG